MAGNFSIASLMRTASTYVPGVRSPDMSRELRFLASVTALVQTRARIQLAEGDPAGLAVFLLSGSGLQALGSQPGHHVVSVEPFLDQARVQLTGRVWMVDEATATGRYVENVRSASETITWITSDLGLGLLPSVVYDTRGGNNQLRFYPGGLEDLQRVSVIDASESPDVSVHDVCEVITLVRDHSLISPQQQIPKMSTWKDAGKWWVAENAEANIQSQIRVGLKVKWPWLTVEHEIPLPSGRFDLALKHFNKTSRTWRYYGVIELKILRTRGSTGSLHTEPATQEVISKGIRQAGAYGIDTHSDWMLLCCFDHRSDDAASETCFDPHRTLAQDKNVVLQWWRVYNKTESLPSRA